MKSNTSVLRIAKNLGSVGLLFSITKESGVMAAETSVDSQIKAMSSSVQQALSQSGSEALADSEIENMIQSHVQSLVEQQAKTEQKAGHKHRKHHKKGKKHHHKHNKQHNSFVQTSANKTAPHAAAPASSNLVKTGAKNDFDAYSQPVDIPIDEVKAITLKVSPTYHLDQVESVTLKSFRKVVGYDTFNSILKKDRDEKKDPSDHYNVTVSMMIRRIPEEKAPAPLKDPYDGSKTLSETLDKGFPYDDADNSPDDHVANWKNKKVNPVTLVGKLNGENISKEALVNLVRDTDSPITNGLVQLESEINGSDGDNLSTLLGENITRGALKNLVTDKPAPITLKLAQKNDFALLDNNVTVSALKNLVTDHPAPITLKLAQTEQKKNDFALLDNNVSVAALKNLVTDHPAPITLKLAQQQAKKNDFALLDNNVSVAALKNLVTDHPAPITLKLAQQ
jgi:hypothetical protein